MNETYSPDLIQLFICIKMHNILSFFKSLLNFICQFDSNYNFDNKILYLFTYLVYEVPLLVKTLLQITDTKVSSLKLEGNLIINKNMSHRTEQQLILSDLKYELSTVPEVACLIFSLVLFFSY